MYNYFQNKIQLFNLHIYSISDFWMVTEEKKLQLALTFLTSKLLPCKIQIKRKSAC